MDSTISRLSGEIKTGIIFFSRSRNCEARSKKWHSSHAKNLEIAQHLIKRTHAVLESSGYDVIVIDEKKQRGTTFGEKIRFAFEDTYALGYDRVILVGNDSVGLSEKYITDSIHFLSKKSFVFGATEGNGLYLIGFDRSFFETQSERIANLPWKTNNLAAEFASLTGFDGSIILPVLSDLNTIEDIKRLLKSCFDVFSEIIRGIVHGTSKVLNSDLISRLIHPEFAKISQRGPPNFQLK